jgi:hypothetical protein
MKTQFIYSDDNNNEIDSLIKEGEDMVKYLCSQEGKTETGLEGFLTGIMGMFGLSGIKALPNKGRNSSDLLRKANSILQQTTQYYSLAFAREQSQLDQIFLTAIKTSISAVNGNINMMYTILSEEDQLLQIEIYGVYLICMVIIFFLILLL